MQELLQRLKERKLVQWTLAYLAGAFAVVQLMDAVAEPLRLGVVAQQVVLVLLGLGFLTALILAWYHGEQGRQQISGPELLLLTTLFVVAGGLIALLRAGSADAPTEGRAPSTTVSPPDARPSIAVIPLNSTSTDEESRMFADGVHDDLLTQLSKVGGLRVISRTSVERFREADEGVPEIARLLGVDAVMGGSVQRVGTRIRVNAQLIDGLTDEHLWAETYDRTFTVEELLDLQAEIARNVAAALRTTLTAEEEADIRSVQTDNARAYTAYLEALAHSQRRLIPEASARSVGLLDEAVALDPGFVAAWSALAQELAFAISYHGSDEDWQRVGTAVQRAEELAPNAYETRLAQGVVRYYGHSDLVGAENAFRAAGAARPGSVEPIFWRGVVAKREGRWEDAFALLDQAARLNPLYPIVWGELRYALLALGRHREALESLERAISIEPGQYSNSRMHLLLTMGDTAAARRQVAEGDEAWPGTSPAWRLTLNHYLQREFGTIADSVIVSQPARAPFLAGLTGADDVVLLLARHGRDDDAVALADSLIRVVAGAAAPASGPIQESQNHFLRGAALAVLGDREGTDSALEEALSAARRVDVFYAAQVRFPAAAAIYLAAGDSARALDELEWCLSDYPSSCTAAVIRLDPWWDPLRGHPRFEALLTRDPSARPEG